MLIQFGSLCSQETEKMSYFCGDSMQPAVSRERRHSQGDEGLFSSSCVRAVTHTGTMDDGEGISKPGAEPKAESCLQPLPAGLPRL